MTKTAFLFPGQGSQYVGMGKKLRDQFAMARHLFEEANDTLGFDLAKLCFEGSSSELMQTMNTQPAILAVSVAAFEIGKEELGWEPYLLAGHSLGEYSALVCSGLLSFSDGLRIVRKRGMLMQAAVASSLGAMAAVIHVPREALEMWCRQASTATKQVVVACCNSRSQHVIAGHQEAVQTVVERLEAVPGAVVKYLNVSAPFHSPLMQTAADQLIVELEQYETQDGQWPIISNVTARPYQRQELNELLYRQMTHPVRWLETMEYMFRNGVDRTVEVGPRQVLTQLMNDTYPAIETYHFDNPLELEHLRSAFNAEYNRAAAIANIREAFTAAVIARSRSDNNDQHRTDVVLPIQQIRQIIEQIERDRGLNMDQAVHQIKEQLQFILTTKQLSPDEQSRIIRKIPSGAVN
ncbi:ACP S-malonyltransferase [Paenibacillus humicus]|uniref:ACP S-malonyltransferase n=1 Tax=Paenibacillus humicus TaxID=412861 RepID=UPI003D26BBB0